MGGPLDDDWEPDLIEEPMDELFEVEANTYYSPTNQQLFSLQNGEMLPLGGFSMMPDLQSSLVGTAVILVKLGPTALTMIANGVISATPLVVIGGVTYGATIAYKNFNRWQLESEAVERIRIAQAKMEAEADGVPMLEAPPDDWTDIDLTPSDPPTDPPPDDFFTETVEEPEPDDRTIVIPGAVLALASGQAAWNLFLLFGGLMAAIMVLRNAGYISSGLGLLSALKGLRKKKKE